MKPFRRESIWPVAFVGVFVVALATRLATWGSHPWADEAAFYATLRTWGHGPQNLYLLDQTQTYDTNLRWLFWQRPVFSIIMAPAAALGFEMFRLWHILLSSFLPVLAIAVLRQVGARRLLAGGAGLLVALHPQFVLWGTRVFPDTLMTLAFGLGILAFLAGRHAWAALAFVLAVWAKEQAYPAVALLFLIALVRGAWARRRLPWPLELGPRASAFVPGTVLGLLPMWYALSIGGAFPGWNAGGAWSDLFDRMFLSSWAAPLVVVAVVFPRTREIGLAALAFPAFFLAYRLTGRGMGPNYYVVTAFLAVLAAAAALDAWWTHASSRSAARYAGGPRAAGWTMAGLLIGITFFPAATGNLGHVGAPVSGHPQQSLLQAVDAERLRDSDTRHVVEVLDTYESDEVFLVDAAWFWPLYPFSDHATKLRLGASDWMLNGLVTPERFGGLVERTSLTVVAKTGTSTNALVRTVYGDCAVAENPSYLVVAGRECPGRSERLRDRLGPS